MQKNFLRALVFFFAFGLLVTGLAHAQVTPNLAGVYSVTGTNPGNTGRYSGTASIVKEGEKYRVSWKVGTVYEGIGALNGNVFIVEWGTAVKHVGTVTYVVQADGVLKGTWFDAKAPNILGTEILTPVK